MEKSERKKQLDVDRFKAQAIETSLNIVASVKNGETLVEERKELEDLHMQKILEHLPEDVDMLFLEEERKVYRYDFLNNKKKPLIWGEDEIKKYIKNLKKGNIWK